MYTLISFTELTKSEVELVLSWRNHPNIKKWMHNQNDITLKEHLAFIQTLKNSKDKEYFLVKSKDEYIGVIDLVGQYLGIYANPMAKRVGDILLKAIINLAFVKKNLPLLKAEVYAQNIKAIKLYERFDFKVISQTNDMLTMELKNENRKF